jgi:hypothetical protein
MKNRGVGVHHESDQVYISGKTVIRATRCGLASRADQEGPASENQSKTPFSRGRGLRGSGHERPRHDGAAECAADFV